MSDLVTIRYSSLIDDMALHVHHMAALMGQLYSMKTNLDDLIKIKILVSSIEFPRFSIVTAAIKSLAEEDIR